MPNKSKTIEAIKSEHKFLSVWLRLHNFNCSMVNDMFNKRAAYKTNNLSVSPSTNAYAILQAAVRDGYSEQLKEDGWNIDNIDINKPIITSTIAVNVPKPDSIDLESISNNLSEIGDEYTNTLFLASAEGGPIAILFMLGRNRRITTNAVKYLNKAYSSFTFVKESDDVISLWNN